MTFDDIIDAFASSDDVPVAAIDAARGGWSDHGPRCRALLQAYVSGQDLSERTERAMLATILLLGERKDTASFPALCALALDAERLESALGEEGTVMWYPAVLISTFGGDPAPLHQLIEDPAADELARGDALLVLAYLVRTDRIAERTVYAYLADLPQRLLPDKDDFVWFGYARAVAALGFVGLARAVEAIIGRGRIPADLLTAEDFWADLRACQQAPKDFSHPIWLGAEEVGDAVEALSMLGGEGEMDPADLGEIVTEPIRNPLRAVGRNDPCPCGSGKKFKKCCLQAGLG